MLTGLADATWTGEHDMVLEHFVQDPSVPALTIFIDPIFGLKLELGMPVQVGTLFSRHSSVELKVLHVSLILTHVSLCAQGSWSPTVWRTLYPETDVQRKMMK